MKKRKQQTISKTIPPGFSPAKSNSRRLTAALLAVFTAASLLMGCGAGSAKSTAAAMPAAVSDSVREEAAAAKMPEMAAVNFASGARSEGAASAEYSGTYAENSEAPAESSDSSAEDSNASAATPANRKLIRNMHMTVETDDFDSLISGITEQISQLGGYIEQSDISGEQTNYQNEPIPRNAYLTARIPAEKLDSFANSVEQGGNVINKSESTQDVTLQYSDTLSRKKSLTIEQERIWALLEKADTLEAVIALEERLSEIRYELESMESQLRLYDNQVDYSTVTLNIHEVTVYTPTSPETIGQRIQNGFKESLKNVSDFCVDLLVAIAAYSPLWIPILILLSAALFIGKRRQWKKGLRNSQSVSFAEEQGLERHGSKEHESEEHKTEEHNIK